MLKEYNKEDIESLISNCLASLEIDKLNVANESLNVPFVSGKISTLLFDLNIYLIKYEQQLDKKEKELFEYYSGKSSPEVYKQKPFQIRIIKSDIPKYINADEDYQYLNFIIKTIKSQIDVLKSYLIIANNRGYNIKNYIDILKFENGIN